MAGVDAYVTYQVSLLEVERGRLEITLLPGLHVICGTRSPGGSRILPEKMLCVLRINLVRSWLSTHIYLGVVGLTTHMTEMVYIDSISHLVDKMSKHFSAHCPLYITLMKPLGNLLQIK